MRDPNKLEEGYDPDVWSISGLLEFLDEIEITPISTQEDENDNWNFNIYLSVSLRGGFYNSYDGAESVVVHHQFTA